MCWVLIAFYAVVATSRTLSESIQSEIAWKNGERSVSTCACVCTCVCDRNFHNLKSPFGPFSIPLRTAGPRPKGKAKSAGKEETFKSPGHFRQK
uniref:Putative secreted peptide n=1 Tax=Anopheles braziliensis TaxID=58242 RepID=A0A2M3ZWS2_9DIPT